MNHCRMALLMLLTLASGPVAAEELRWDAKLLYEKGVSKDLRLGAAGTALELEQGELLEDDGPAAGYSYKPNEEKLSPSIWIKKEFVIADARTNKATLLVGPGGNLQAIINGQSHVLKKQGKAGNYWDAYLLPPDALRQGKNEIVLHGSGKVWIARDDEFAAGSRTRTTHPNRSAKSSDGGKTWTHERLGTKGDVDGEYYVRLFLDRYRSQGSLTLPVLDAGNLTGQPIAAPLASLGPVRVDVQAETGVAGKIAVRVRSGTTYVPTEKSWSAWQELGARGVTLEKPSGRYVQLALDLATADPLQSPKLTQVLVEASPQWTGEWAKKLKLIGNHNQTIVRTSIPFEYEPFDHPRLKALRERYKLDDVVKGAQGEFELITRLAAWSSRQWQRGHLKDVYPSWDALEILKPHTDGTPVGGFCQQYNVVFLQACESFGIPGRAVSLGGGDHGARFRSGHEVVEIWSNDHRKWVYVDGQMGHYLADQESGTPLSLLELRARQLAALRGKSAAGVKRMKIAETGHDWQGLDSFPPFLELRLIPRSNFLQEKAPLPLNQGMRGWFWTGHHVWTDEHWPASLLYGNRVGNRRNWEWTLNQVHYVLEATDIPGELRVHLETETPGFETFLADIDGTGKRPFASGFLWKLRAGTNRVRIWSRNGAGREGSASEVLVEKSEVRIPKSETSPKFE